MSASQKLKALGVRYDTPFHEYGPDFGPDDEYATVLVRALPQIVAVVTEAEFYLQESTAGRPALTIGIEQSLSALEEALS